MIRVPFFKQKTMYDRIICHCTDAILQQTKKPLFVSVVGESGSGKSYFTKKLQEELRRRHAHYSFLNHDDFLIPRKEREALREKVYLEGEFKGKTYWEILENWYYLGDFVAVLEKLQNNQKADYYPYLHDTGEISTEPKTIAPNPIILLENKLFLEKMDFIIELEVDREHIIKRKIERDSDVRTPEQTIEMHEKAQGFFWDRCKPKLADIVIDNNDYTAPKLIRG